MKWRYEETRQAVITTELGVTRALAAAFGGKSLQDLPDFEEASRPKGGYVRSGFHAKFEAANKGRAIQTG